MLPLAHQLRRRWRRLYSLHNQYNNHNHNHNLRLLSATPTTTEHEEASDATEEEHPSFGRLAARTPRNVKEREFDKEFNITRNITKQQYAGEFKPHTQSTDPRRTEYHKGRRSRVKEESELSWGSGSQQDDMEDLDDYFIHGRRSANSQELGRVDQEPHNFKDYRATETSMNQELGRKDQEPHFDKYSIIPRTSRNHQELGRVDQEPHYFKDYHATQTSMNQELGTRDKEPYFDKHYIPKTLVNRQELGREDQEPHFDEYSISRTSIDHQEQHFDKHSIPKTSRTHQEPHLNQHSIPKTSMHHQEPRREEQEPHLNPHSIPRRSVYEEPRGDTQEPQWELSDLQRSPQEESELKGVRDAHAHRTTEESTENGKWKRTPPRNTFPQVSGLKGRGGGGGDVYSNGRMEGLVEEQGEEEDVVEDDYLDAEEIQDEGDVREERYQSLKYERRHRPRFYANKMLKLGKERKLGEAIKILEEEMPKVGAKPDSFCYHVLINACGRAGYTKKAFQLYNQMKKRGLKVDPAAYTGLFMACAHSPWPTTDGLTRATQLRSDLKEKRFHFNQIVCHSMIKAFGWCGDIGTAFQVVDDMLQEGLIVTTETMNFLLQACVTDKDTGFRHAIKVWRKMRMLKLRPDIHSYNLLMRVVKECAAGDPNLTSDLLKEEQKKDTRRIENKDKKTIASESAEIKLLNNNNNNSIMEGSESGGEVVTEVRLVRNPSSAVLSDSGGSVLPNVIARRLNPGNVIALGALDKPCDRLAIIGGPSGVLSQMRKDRVTPNLKTFTQMLESLPGDTQAEEALMESMQNLKVKPDTQFFNMLIRKRNFRYDYKAAREVISLMQDHHLVPDLITYGCVALGCRNDQAATQLLNDMDDSNFRPNLEIMSMLVKNSINQQDFLYAKAMLTEMRRRNIVPDDSLISTLEETRADIHKNILLHQTENTKEEKKSNHAKIFLSAYKEWLRNTQVNLPEHPWAQYRQ